MSTWGIAFISLGFLWIAYRNWTGLLFVLIGGVMILVARNQKKKAEKRAQEQLQAHKNIEIKTRK